MTIKDIAKEAGYSVGTVSRALNNQSGVSEKAKERIMEVVEKYHFQLNTNAKHLKQQIRSGIAVLIKGAQNLLFAYIVEQLQGLIKQRGFECTVYYLKEDENEVEHAVQICQRRNPQGILFLGSDLNHFREDFSKIRIPCVLVTNYAGGLDYPLLSSVSSDDRSAARFAVEHLILAGHTRIGILGGKRHTSYPADRRLEGCALAFAKHEILFEPGRQLVESYFSIEDGYRAMERLLLQMNDLTAVFAMSDVMAIGAIRALADHGIRVPEDVSVMGFDGLDLVDYLLPRLTTIRQHREKIASRSLEILVDSICNQAPAVHELEPVHLIPGETVRRYSPEGR